MIMESLRILWFNWRCIKHPLAGGAEVYTHEIARRLARQGHEIILVTSRPPKLPREECIDGYRVLRGGGKYAVYLHAWKTYRRLKENGWRPDLFIDEVNTIPFLTPLYAEEPIIMLIHQLCMDCWNYAIHPIIQPLGWWVEKKLHKIYVEASRRGKVKAIITVSPSTKQDLVSLGYPEEKISIIPNGLDWNHYGDCIKLAGEKEDLAIYVGRITPYKRIEELLEAWRKVEEQHGSAKLAIAGRPDPKYLRKLLKKTRRLGLKRVSFKTNISQEEKKQLLAKAKTLIYTSTREGWGQTILEAATCKTPTIAYNVPGLRDSVKHMETGILVPLGNIDKLAEAIIKMLKDNNLREKLAENTYKQAKQYTWNKTAEEFMKLINYVKMRE